MNATSFPRTVTLLAVAPLFGAALLGFVERRAAKREADETELIAAGFATQELAARIVICSDRGRSDKPGSPPRALPPSTAKVPVALPRGTRVATHDEDWDERAFRCADFRPLERQAFQLQWEVDAKPRPEWATASGNVRAWLDLDGDGIADHLVTTEVGCTKDLCMVAPDAARWPLL